MKRTILICSAIGGVALAIVGSAARAGVEGSKHDFSHEEWTGGDACTACHTPESELPPTAPKWNAAADLSRRFGTTAPRAERTGRTDQNGASDASNRRLLRGRRDQLGDGTRTCLRCHDGSLANDLVPTTEPHRFTNTFHPGRTAAGHGQSSHPVGVPYPSFDRKYHPVGAVIADGAVSLPAGQVECISCHDPHDEIGLDHMLVRSNGRSALCLSCHRK